jgi:hypothetical protein
LLIGLPQIMQRNNFSEDIDTFLKPQGTKLTNEK